MHHSKKIQSSKSVPFNQLRNELITKQEKISNISEQHEFANVTPCIGNHIPRSMQPQRKDTSNFTDTIISFSLTNLFVIHSNVMC